MKKERIRLSAPATTANVGPGYDIFAVTMEAPADEFTMALNETGEIRLSIEGEAQNIPLNIVDNTAGLALQELCQRKGLKCGFDLTIIKKMPSGGGLGTTGASAAAAIVGANHLLDLGLSNNELIDLARMGEVASGGSPHADNVAAAILGGFVLVKSYRPIDVLRLDIPEFPIVLGVIRKSQRSTRGFITYEIGQEKLKEQMARCSRVIHAVHIKDMEEFGKAISVDHIAEPVRSAAIPGYHELKKAVLSGGAYGFNISGGGSSVFAVCPSNKQKEIAAIMEDMLQDNPHFVKVICTHTSNYGVRIL
jgi:homoserine kinase